MNRKVGKNKKKGGKKGREAERVVNLVRESLPGHVVPEFEWGAKSDPEFFEKFIKLPKTCLGDAKALPAKYRLMINMCLLAHVGHLRGIPHYMIAYAKILARTLKRMPLASRPYPFRFFM